jgi:hypothetical protein
VRHPKAATFQGHSQRDRVAEAILLALALRKRLG